MAAIQAEYTAAGTRSTSGDGTAIIAAPDNDRHRWHITGLILTVNNPGTDTVTAIVKSGSDTLAKFVINGSQLGVATNVEMVCGAGEAVYLNLSGAVSVNWTVSYYRRDDGRPA